MKIFQKKRIKQTIRLSLLLSMVMILFPADCFSWWHDEWQYRRKISFDTTVAGADIKENLDDIPILIRLHTGNFNFFNVKQDGEDIRFVSSDDATVLKHHMEKFDAIDEMAVIWVKIPKLSGHTNLEYIWIYYGNEAAVGGQAPRASFDSAQVAAYHFGEVEGAPQDSTANEHHAVEFIGGQGLPGIVGNGTILGGGKDNMVVKDTPRMNFSNGFTLSAWIRITHSQNDAYLFSMEDEKKKLAIGIDETKLYAEIVNEAGEIVSTEKSADIVLDTWQFIAVSIMPKDRITLYIDGIEMGWTHLDNGIPEMEGDLIIGSDVPGEHAFVGELDEVRIADTARSEGWLRAEYISQGPDGKLALVEEEVMGGGEGWLKAFYLLTVMKNITVDGWAVIGVLLILAIASWFVILNKSIFLYIVEKADNAFLSAYAEQDDPITLMAAGGEFNNSMLYQVYESGCMKLKERLSLKEAEKANSTGGNGLGIKAEQLGSRSLNSVRTMLEKGIIEQSKRMNGWLVILTLAISGGPFLGLLGTVWGVMNTFAAMAEAGEANIMAIAPGVASALSTTVTGLLVAIPALFGYNYITGKIKNITADLSIFVDQFIVRVEEKHGRAS